MFIEKDALGPTDKTHETALVSLVEAAASLGALNDFDAVVSAVISHTARIFDAAAVWLLIYDRCDDELKMCRYWGPEAHLFKDIAIRPGVGVAGSVFSSQKAVVVDEAAEHPASMFYKKLTSVDIPGVAIFPLTAGERRLGVLGFASHSCSAVNESSHCLDMGSRLTELAAHALERTALIEKYRSSEDALRSDIKSVRLLNELGMDLVSDLNLAAIIHKVVRYAAEILDADAAVINIANRARTGTDSVYFYNMPPGADELLKAKGTLARTVFENPRQVLINDYASYPGALDEFVRAGLSSVMMVPVVSKGVVLATLSAVSFRGERSFSVEEFNRLEVVARHVAIAVENAVLYSEQIDTRKQIEAYAAKLRLLNELAHEVVQEKGPMNMAVQLAKSARRLVECEAATVTVTRPGSDREPMIAWLTHDGNFGTLVASDLDLATHDGLYSEMYRSKRPIRIDDVLSHPRSKGLPEGHIELRGLLGVPLIDSDGEFMGQVMLTGRHDSPFFTTTDEELLLALCSRVAIAIERAEAYERQHRIAETLQQAILAVPTHLPGVEVGIVYESAAEATKVGGDFYDLFELKGGRIGMLIGDVSGKGLEAATITSMVKSTIRAFAYKGLEPAGVLSEANRVIYEQLRPSQFVTMTFGVIDMSSRMLVKSRAGHPEILIGRDEGYTFCESDSNLPLGILADIEYAQNEILLRSGDLLILYTDGLIEAKCDNMMLGDELLLETVNNIARATDARQLARDVAGIAKDFSGSSLQDDMAIVVLKLAFDAAEGD